MSNRDEALRASLGSGSDAGIKPASFKTKFGMRSPSVPNFKEFSFQSRNSSVPTLAQLVGDGSGSENEVNREVRHRKSHLKSTHDTVDGGISVIDMYGDVDDGVASHGRYDSSYELDSEADDDEEHQLIDNESGSVFRGRGKPMELDNSDNFDRYGFKKQNGFVTMEAYDEWWEGYMQYCARRKLKWEHMLEKHEIPMEHGVPSKFPPKNDKVKRYVRKGIPADWRGSAWWFFAKGQETLDQNLDVYDDLLEKMGDLDAHGRKGKKKVSPDIDIIERDLNRTFPDNIHFQKEHFQNGEPPMIKSLRRVLVAFSIYNPKIGYCQSMNFLAGLLLLFMEEEKVFWMMVIITSRYLPNVHNVNLEGVNVDQGVLMLCIKEYMPEIWDIIKPAKDSSSSDVMKNEFLIKLPPLTLCTASWFMSCFVGILPIETTLRIWDCVFYEGSHFLFKASLAIFKLSEQELLKNRKRRNKKNPNDTDMEVFQIIQSFPKQIIDPNDIFEKVFLKKRISLNRLDQQEIDKCRKYVSSQRVKYKHFNEINDDKGNVNLSSIVKEIKMTDDLIDDALSSELIGFKNFHGVHWNNSIKEKVKQMTKKKDKQFTRTIK